MIIPINNYILIEPLKRESFIPTDKGNYEEVGVVIDFDGFLEVKMLNLEAQRIKKGDKIFFDSWLAGKYPTGKDGEYFWLVKYDDIRAIEHEDEIPK